MKWREQRLTDSPRYTIVPRTLVFLRHGLDLMLLRGAPTKRLWANQLNGIGGHIEPNESPLDGARREVLEETGITAHQLSLRAIVHIEGRHGHAGVIFYAFTGQAPSRNVRASIEGSLEWHPLDALPYEEMVADLRELLPLILTKVTDTAIVYGHYAPDENDDLCFHFELA